MAFAVYPRPSHIAFFPRIGERLSTLSTRSSSSFVERQTAESRPEDPHYNAAITTLRRPQLLRLLRPPLQLLQLPQHRLHEHQRQRQTLVLAAVAGGPTATAASWTVSSLPSSSATTTTTATPILRSVRAWLMAAAAAAVPWVPPALAAQIAVGVSVNGMLWAVLSSPAGRRRQHVLTDAGVRHGAALGTVLWGCAGPSAWGLCVLFLVAGSAATRLGRARKESRGIAEARGGARGPANLWGAAGAAALCAVALLAADVRGAARAGAVLRVAYVAALAAKMSDTCASEVGKAYGGATFLVTSGRRVPRGTEGAVSAAGTAAGVAGSLVAAGYALAVGLLGGVGGVAAVVAAAFVANVAESVIGATVQEERGWSNEFVNFLNTSIGAAVAAGIMLAFGCCGL